MSYMEIIFTYHAKFKLDLLKEHGFTFTEDEVKDVIESPDFVKKAKYDRLAAHKSLDDRLALRVIYEKNDTITVVTIMVVKRNRYDI